MRRHWSIATMTVRIVSLKHMYGGSSLFLPHGTSLAFNCSWVEGSVQVFLEKRDSSFSLQSRLDYRLVCFVLGSLQRVVNAWLNLYKKRVVLCTVIVRSCDRVLGGGGDLKFAYDWFNSNAFSYVNCNKGVCVDYCKQLEYLLWDRLVWCMPSKVDWQV